MKRSKIKNTTLNEENRNEKKLEFFNPINVIDLASSNTIQTQAPTL